MHIERVRVKNFRSFEDTHEIVLQPGFNLFIGQNNVGKTALLETLVPGQFSAKPHRTTRQSRTAVGNPTSRLEINISVTGTELRDILLSSGSFMVPIPTEWRNGNRPIEFFEEIIKREVITFGMCLNSGAQPNVSWSPARSPSFSTGTPLSGPPFAVQFAPRDDRSGFVRTSGNSPSFDDSMWSSVLNAANRAIYRFKAERLNIGLSQIGGPAQLLPNASNLPSVLLQLHRNPSRLDRLNAHMADIFPNVHSARAVPINENQCEIRIWNIDPKTERDDLTAPLAECGTGVGQVLAILYIALTSDVGQIIIIDEPNSFLHPGAARKLINILKQYPQQYIIATHSPEVIVASEPRTLNLITWRDEESVVENLQVDQVADIRRALLDVGAKLSDVFGADAVLWVEGPTEEECFPSIIKKVDPEILVGTAIVAVRNTGDLESKRPSAKMIWEIYERITTAKALLPRTVAFSLDTEGRTEAETDELRQRSKGMVRFLPRRCYENFLLSPVAIAAVLNSQPTFQGKPTTADIVRDWLQRHGGDPTYRGPNEWNGDLSDIRWLKEVRAANLLSDLFSTLSETKEEYRKTLHSVQLTEWLLENDPSHLKELSDFLTGFFKR